MNHARSGMAQGSDHRNGLREHDHQVDIAHRRQQGGQHT